MKSSENRVPLNEDMANYLKKKRYEVESKHKEVLLAKRMEVLAPVMPPWLRERSMAKIWSRHPCRTS